MTSLHVASWNVEGLTNYLGPTAKRLAVAEAMKLVGSPDVLCLQEVNLRDRDEDELHLAAGALPGWSLLHSLARDPKNATFRGGRTYGVATYVREELEVVPLPRLSWEREGRILGLVLPEWRLAIVNVYAVNGTDKPYWDHDLGAFEGDRHGWKRRFHDRIAELGRTLKQADLDLLLIGDWNVTQYAIDTTPRLRTEEPHAGSRAHFQHAVVEALDVVDVFRARNPEARAYTWFNRFAKRHLDAARVDYALLSRSRLASVTGARIDEALVGSLRSDHAPLHVELALS